MATYGARRLLQMADNTTGIIAIELLAACQGIDFRRPQKTSPLLENIHHLIRNIVPYYAEDRFFAPDIAAVTNLITSGDIRSHLNFTIFN
jgi:histidine ammonia-lyase